MKFFRPALATPFLGAVVRVGAGTTGYAQQSVPNCNCMVVRPGASIRYGYEAENSSTCYVTTCWI